MKLLLIEDDIKLVTHLLGSLKEQGFIVNLLQCSEDVVEILGSPYKPDFIILDRLLGAFDSKLLLPDLRRKWQTVPLIVLSAISTPNERTDIINLGADDYLGKPFSTQELLARIRALLRRTSVPIGNYIQVGNMVIDSLKRLICVGENSENIPAREFSVLRTLAIEPDRVWSKDELLDYVWGQSTDVDTNVVESTIANLRKKLDEVGANVAIRNMRNVGYWIAQ